MSNFHHGLPKSGAWLLWALDYHSPGGERPFAVKDRYPSDYTWLEPTDGDWYDTGTSKFDEDKQNRIWENPDYDPREDPEFDPTPELRGVPAEDLNRRQRTWYHVSPHEIAPGEELKPFASGETGPSFDSQRGMYNKRQFVDDEDENPLKLPPSDTRNRANYVFMSPGLQPSAEDFQRFRDRNQHLDDASAAKYYDGDANHATWWKKHMYDVREPWKNGSPANVYEVKPHGKPQPWNMSHGLGYVAPGATVLRKVDPTEISEQFGGKGPAMGMHQGAVKSGPWLLEASEHYALDVRPDAIAPGWGAGSPPQQQPPPRRKAPRPTPPAVPGDWRTGDGGAFRSDVRPAMSSDVPHPGDVLDPSNKRQHALLQRLAGAQDPDHDPWDVLGGSGQNFEGLVNNHVEHLAKAGPEHNYEGRVWYRAAHEGTKDLADKTTGDHGRTVATMSAFSPKTAWDENLEKGHHFVTHYDGRDPNFSMPGLQDPVEKAKAIYHAPGDSYNEVIRGPKTSAFMRNILDPSPLREPRPGEHDDAGYYEHPGGDWRNHPDQDVTIDTHHVRMANTVPGSSLGGMRYDTPDHFGKKVSVNGQRFDPSYDLYSRAAWEATRRHNAAEPDPARHITPKQAQAIAWTKFKHDVDTDPDKKKRLQPEPGTRPKSMGPLTDPIPRYQKDRGPDWWNDPRRPEVHLRETPNWHNRNRSVARVAAADDGTVFGEWLGDYIRRNPQHPEPEPVEAHEQERLGPHPHEAAVQRDWYTTAPVAPRKPRRPNAPRYGPARPRKASWYVTADTDVDGKDQDDQSAPAANGQVGTPAGMAGPATDPHAPSYDSMFPAPHVTPAPIGGGGGGYSGGGGGYSGGGAPGGGGAQGPASVVPGPGGSVPLVKNPDGSYTSPDPNWKHLIDRESGGRNIIQAPSTHDVNSGGNEAFGIFQITPGTWSAHGGQGSVYNSTPEQQAQVAADILRKNPSGSDWGAGMSGRENAQGLMRALTPPAAPTAPTAPTAPMAPTPGH